MSDRLDPGVELAVLRKRVRELEDALRRIATMAYVSRQAHIREIARAALREGGNG
jgi:hypothetical protein